MTQVDAWHYLGNSDFHTREYGRAFMERCKSKLPRTELPIRVGGTGYIQLTGPTKVTHGWTEDDVGRMVCVVKDTLVFQRYKNGQVFMKGTIDRIDPAKSCFADHADEECLNTLVPAE
jgi:hypothetical protein